MNNSKIIVVQKKSGYNAYFLTPYSSLINYQIGREILDQLHNSGLTKVILSDYGI